MPACSAFLAAVLVLSSPGLADENAPPRLAVLIVVDQMRADYLTRYAAHFSDGGLRRLIGGGAHFTAAYYSYAGTATGPGHATLVTGRLPRAHGIVANDWFLDPNRTDSQESIEDPACTIVGATETPSGIGVSPRRLIGPTLGDQLRLSDARSKVVSIALKDRAAIMMGGRRPNRAFWWDSGSGRFVTSTYYDSSLPDYVKRFNEGSPARAWFGKSWEPLLDSSAYAGCRPVKKEWLDQDYELGPSFPHALPHGSKEPDKKFHKAVTATPFGNDLLLRFAEQVADGEQLGRDEAPDLYCIGLSSFDVAGHVFGPESPEMLDMLIRLDRQLAGFLAFLDKQIGPGRYVVAVTADHGVSSIPQQLEAVGIEGGLFDAGRAVKDLNAALRKRFGSTPDGKPLVVGIHLPWVYFNRSITALETASRQVMLDEAAGLLRKMPGLEAVFTGEDLSGPPPSKDERSRYRAWRSYCSGRSGEVYVQLAPGWHEHDDKTCGHTPGSTHDRHVPIVLFGPGVRAGRYACPADPLDLAPTLANLLDIEPPMDAIGRVLHEGLETSPSGTDVAPARASAKAP